MVKIWPFLAKIAVFECFYPITSKRRIESIPNFWYGSCSYGVLWENHTLYAGKILVWRNFSHFKAKIWPFLSKIVIFECFWPITRSGLYRPEKFKLLLSTRGIFFSNLHHKTIWKTQKITSKSQNKKFSIDFYDVVQICAKYWLNLLNPQGIDTYNENKQIEWPIKSSSWYII